MSRKELKEIKEFFKIVDAIEKYLIREGICKEIHKIILDKQLHEQSTENKIEELKSIFENIVMRCVALKVFGDMTMEELRCATCEAFMDIIFDIEDIKGITIIDNDNIFSDGILKNE